MRPPTNHTALGVTISTGPSSGTTFVLFGAFSTTAPLFAAGGWDGAQVIWYWTKPGGSSDVGSFNPASWAADAISVTIGTSGIGASPWSGRLRAMEIYDRVLGAAELGCLAASVP